MRAPWRGAFAVPGSFEDPRELWLPGRPRQRQDAAKAHALRALAGYVQGGHYLRVPAEVDGLLDELADLIGHAG